ncbi:oxygenase MpaB family protein [Nocardia salmonicida]|uniref:oxygenase MpaB family protein n=1 Tax=Nocardia salmonicida TaxID=53431 RepID=UPI0036700545
MSVFCCHRGRRSVAASWRHGDKAGRFGTAGFLPQRCRDELALPWSERRQRSFEITMRTLGRVLSVLPEHRRLYPFESCLADMRCRRALGRPLA